MLVEFGKASLLSKARAQPDKVRQVLNKIKSDGLLPTMEAVFSRLDEPLPLGYCNAGVVLEVGEGVEGFRAGDRVASNGQHAEVVSVPQNLCAKIPEGVSDEDAAFTVLSSIGLQGIRLLNPTLGETMVVTGLGLIGLASVQILIAGGCRVLGIDPDPRRAKMARQFGATTVDLSRGEDPLAAADAFSNGRGVDGVLITASSKDSGLIRQAATMCRKRGRIVLVGVVGMELSRTDFYKKELSFQVSCSYGPGRYDTDYEERGHDYPAAYVRWTEQRNFEAILDLMASGKMQVSQMISRRLCISDAAEAYQALSNDRDALGIVLKYQQGEPLRDRSIRLLQPHSSGAGRVVVGVIGAGNFARMTLLPALKQCDVSLRTIISAGGVSGMHAGRKFGFEKAATDYREVLNDPAINLAVILTRHDLHASMVLEALKAGKHVAVEKPLCLNLDELASIRDAVEAAPGRQLLVGFNRRFSPHAVRMRELLAARSQPLSMSMLVNAGAVSSDSWVQDAATGGGRIIGEGCHWIDLMMFLAGSPILRVSASRMGQEDDCVTVTCKMA
ncbi:MAG TPA: bi-domain-containing oxidoreductase, partial [Phycisphaerae bacterium]|nr:bi-domain-containing oxidoreductase [Phycisphaerae bacterium]